jgi:hypothetical protein
MMIENESPDTGGTREKSEYETAVAAYEAADRACREAGAKVPEATHQLQRNWSYAQKRLIKGDSGDEARDHALLRDKRTYEIAQQGGPELVAARDVAVKTMHAAYAAWQATPDAQAENAVRAAEQAARKATQKEEEARYTAEVAAAARQREAEKTARRNQQEAGAAAAQAEQAGRPRVFKLLDGAKVDGVILESLKDSIYFPHSGGNVKIFSVADGWLELRSSPYNTLAGRDAAETARAKLRATIEKTGDKGMLTESIGG